MSDRGREGKVNYRQCSLLFPFHTMHVNIEYQTLNIGDTVSRGQGSHILKCSVESTTRALVFTTTYYC